MGRKYGLLYSLSTCVFNFWGAIIYFNIICNLIFLIVNNFQELPERDRMMFDGLSYQTIGICTAFASFFLLLIKDFGRLIKISQYGIFIVIFIFIFTIYRGSLSLYEGKVNLQNTPLATSECNNLFGIFLEAYFVHSAINQIMKKNNIPENNERDVKIGFLLTTFIYSFLGIFGAFAIADLGENDKIYNTYFDYFERKNIFVTGIEVMFTIYLLSLLPVMWYGKKLILFFLFYFFGI